MLLEYAFGHERRGYLKDKLLGLVDELIRPLLVDLKALTVSFNYKAKDPKSLAH